MRRALIIYLLIEAIMIIGCSREDDSCRFQDESVAVVNDINARSVHFQSFNNVTLISDGDSISRENYAIWLDVDPTYVGSSAPGWPGSLLACTKVPLLNQYIKSIHIFTRLDFAASREAGADVVDLFSFMATDEEVSLSDKTLLNEYFKTYFLLFLRLHQPPETDRFVQFDIQLELDNGVVYELATDRIYISNS